MIRVLLLTGVLVFIAGCSGDSDIDKYIEDVKKSAKHEIEPVAPPVPYKSIDYKVGAARSPFRKSMVRTGSATGESVVELGVVQQPRPDVHRVREYLERYKLSDFIMVGTLSKHGITWGLVQDSTGLVHAVKVGDYIGENSGKVAGIQTGQIDVVEMVPDGKGGWMDANAYISMKTEEK